MTQRRSLPSQTGACRNEDVIACVRYILCREGSKLPIPRVDIANHLKSTCDTPKNDVNNVIAAADKHLRNVYGYKLETVDTKTVQYILVLLEPCDSPISPLMDVHEQRLLNVALAHIFMSGGSVKDEDMWTFLIKAKLMNENDGAVIKLFTKKFTSQLYISAVTEGEGELAKKKFIWGPRANKETSKMFILNKIAEALNKTPDHWCEQHKIATSEAPPATSV
ncbi:non-structural maintenance of chromosomes element 3 homolog [Epargyreus clarus]|uniref:non-structural maintenance of chromosomes element 3 homolog n=1 Tax=Epargyreus clarus TaxID=520877 RepID=UPI003C2F6633